MVSPASKSLITLAKCSPKMAFYPISSATVRSITTTTTANKIRAFQVIPVQGYSKISKENSLWKPLNPRQYNSAKETVDTTGWNPTSGILEKPDGTTEKVLIFCSQTGLGWVEAQNLFSNFT